MAGAAAVGVTEAVIHADEVEQGVEQAAQATANVAQETGKAVTSAAKSTGKAINKGWHSVFG